MTRIRTIIIALAAPAVLLGCVSLATKIGGVVQPAPNGGDAPDATVTTEHKLGAIEPTPTAFAYVSGASGTVVVPPNSYVSGIEACASLDGGAATMVIGLTGTSVDGSVLDGSTAGGSTVPIPVGCWSPPSLSGALFSMGPKTTITFAATTSYWVSFSSYGSF